MPRIRFNHMELTVAEGALDDAMRSDLQRFYGDVLGWTTMDIPLLGQSTFYMSPDDGQFILVAERPRRVDVEHGTESCEAIPREGPEWRFECGFFGFGSEHGASPTIDRIRSRCLPLAGQRRTVSPSTIPAAAR